MNRNMARLERGADCYSELAAAPEADSQSDSRTSTCDTPDAIVRAAMRVDRASGPHYDFKFCDGGCLVREIRGSEIYNSHWRI
jgi:hypothetical protein